MNQLVSRSKVAISLFIALALSVLYLSPAWQAWMPPWVVMVTFYWLIFQTVSMGVWVVWLVGLLSGCLLGDPLGLSSFLMVLLAWPLLHYQRMIQFMAGSSRWLLWLLVVLAFVFFKVILMAAFGDVVLQAASFKPMLSALLLAPVLYFALSVFAQWSTLGKRQYP